MSHADAHAKAPRRRSGKRLMGLTALALAAGIGVTGIASAQRPFFNPPPARADIPAGQACSLALVRSYGASQLVARAAPGVSGRWSLTVRSGNLDVDQAGQLTGGAQLQELTRITLDAERRAAVNHGAASLYGPAYGPPASPVNAVLTVRNDRGRVICRARPDLR